MVGTSFHPAQAREVWLYDVMLRYRPQPRLGQTAALANIAGAVAPVDLAGTNVPAAAGMKFSAVAEVNSSAVDDEGDPSVVRTSRPRSAVILIPWRPLGKTVDPWRTYLFLNR